MKFVSIHEAILDSMSEAVYVVDRDMRIQYANPAAEKMTGYSLDESTGRHCDQIFCERSSRCEAGCPPMKAMLEQTPIFHREAETRNKKGDVRQTEISFSPFFDDGQCIGAVIVIKDISDLKAAEVKIKRTAEQREQLIQELQNALNEVNTLSGLLPICSSCKKIRDDKGYWNNLEMYISQHSAVEFSHGICPDCAQTLYPEYFKKTQT
jgi:PAS domain S-box-containing protein